MKKSIIIVILFGSLLGFVFGSIFFKNYKGVDYLDQDGNIYYLQYGVYTTKDAAISNSENIKEQHFIIERDTKYYVYLGVTTNYDRALQLKEKYEMENIYIYIRSDYVENSEILDKLKEYDKKITDDNVETVMKEIFENDDISL